MKEEKKVKLEEYISIEDIFDGLIFGLQKENKILRKKINNKKLSKEEEFFDKYIFPPSSTFRMIRRRIK